MCLLSAALNSSFKGYVSQGLRATIERLLSQEMESFHDDSSQEVSSQREVEETTFPSSPDEEKPKRRSQTRRGTTRKITGRNKCKSHRNRKQCSPYILQWLHHNYEMVPGACLPRSVLYTHYQDFCKRNQIDASSAASFGKIIRMKFPNLSTRRLGTRGQSKYHYYGLAIKESSVYYRSVYSKKGITRFSGSTKRDVHCGQNYNPSCKTGILLPSFPKVSEMSISKTFPMDKVETFLLMYRAHCQRILDLVVRANFNEVQGLLLHFWKGIPQHILSILDCQMTVDVIVVCDFILYKCLCEVLIPSSLQPLTDGLMVEVIMFSHRLIQWVSEALKDLPSVLGASKVQVAEMFGKSLRRQTALVQLSKDARAVMRNSDTVSGILNCWQSKEFSFVLHHTIENSNSPDKPTSVSSQYEMDAKLCIEFANELEQLFVKQSSLETYFEWLDSIIEKKICEPSEHGYNMTELIQEFLATWNGFYILVEKGFSVVSKENFDSFCKLHLVLDAYVSYVVELLQMISTEQQHRNALRNSIGEEYSCQKPCSYVKPQHISPSLDIGKCLSKLEETPKTSAIQSNDSYSSKMFNKHSTLHQDACSHSMYNFVENDPSRLLSPCVESASPYHIETKGMCFMGNIPHTSQSSPYSINSPPSQSSLASPDSHADYEFSRSSASSMDSPKQPALDRIFNNCAQVCSAHPVVAGMTKAANIINQNYSNQYEFFHDMIGAFPYQECCAPPMVYGYMPLEHQGQHELLHYAPNPDEFLVNPYCVSSYTKQMQQQTHSAHIH